MKKETKWQSKVYLELYPWDKSQLYNWRNLLENGFQLYAFHVEESKEGKELELQDYHLLQEFVEIFQ